MLKSIETIKQSIRAEARLYKRNGKDTRIRGTRDKEEI
jgi:hypothetical protein